MRIWILTIKYWLKGDSWRAAGEYARWLVRSFK
jgi:hypothetical protein